MKSANDWLAEFQAQTIPTSLTDSVVLIQRDASESFARECAAKLRACVCDPMFSERERLTFGLATAIVEALAREFGGPP